jgi:hypothetical protein
MKRTHGQFLTSPIAVIGAVVISLAAAFYAASQLK